MPYAERAKTRIGAETSGRKCTRGIVARYVDRRVSRKNGRGERCVSVGFMTRRWFSIRVVSLPQNRGDMRYEE